jgi:hypothetical protein
MIALWYNFRRFSILSETNIMAFDDNERLQELALVAGDKVSMVSKKVWVALLITIVGAVPLYFLAKQSFIRVALVGYQSPEIIHTSAVKQPLTILDKGIFDLGDNNYSAFVKVKNIEFDWGVPDQSYTAEFKTLGGTSITKVEGSTFVLPAREKIIIFSRFSAQQKPERFDFALGETHFIHRPMIDFNFELERRVVNNALGGLIVSAGIKNLTPFTVKKVNLPVVVYNSQNQIVAVNFTYIDDLLSGETRTFQYFWPRMVAGAVRAEISPEVNIFDRNVFQVAPGGPSF